MISMEREFSKYTGEIKKSLYVGSAVVRLPVKYLCQGENAPIKTVIGRRIADSYRKRKVYGKP